MSRVCVYRAGFPGDEPWRSSAAEPAARSDGPAAHSDPVYDSATPSEINQ